MATDSSVVVDSKFDLKRAATVFTKDRLWPLYMFMAFCVNVPQTSVLLFLPQIIARFNFGIVKTNLYTVAPNVVGAVVTIAVAISSDRIGDRAVHLACCLSLTCIGFIVLATVDTTTHVAVGYFCCFLLPSGAYVSSPLLTTWYNNNTPDENHRMLLTGVLVALGNAMGLITSNIFLPQDAPNYIMASIITAAFGACGVVLVLAVGFYMKFDNQRRNREQGADLGARDVITHDMGLGQKDANWRWTGGVP